MSKKRKVTNFDMFDAGMGRKRRNKRARRTPFDKLSGALASKKKRGRGRKGTGLVLLMGLLLRGPNRTRQLATGFGDDESAAAERRAAGRNLGQYLVDQMFGKDDVDRQIEAFDRARRDRSLGGFLADQMNPGKRIDQLDNQIEQVIEDEGLRLKDGANMVDRLMWGIRNIRAFKRFVR